MSNSSAPFYLTRAQLQKFLPSPEAVRFFEALQQSALSDTPSELQDIALQAGVSQDALESLQGFVSELYKNLKDSLLRPAQQTIFIPQFSVEPAQPQVSEIIRTTRQEVYTPTLTGVANVASSTANTCNWSRQGDLVVVNGFLNITATAATTLTQLGISLPVASTLSTQDALNGTAVLQTNAGPYQAATVYADPTNNRAQLQLWPADTNSDIVNFNFTYRVQ